MVTVKALEAAKLKLKSEQKDAKGGLAIKSEANPSPSKKLATDFGRKIKNLKGDTTLIKDWIA